MRDDLARKLRSSLGVLAAFILIVTGMALAHGGYLGPASLVLPALFVLLLYLKASVPEILVVLAIAGIAIGVSLPAVVSDNSRRNRMRLERNPRTRIGKPDRPI